MPWPPQNQGASLKQNTTRAFNLFGPFNIALPHVPSLSITRESVPSYIGTEQLALYFAVPIGLFPAAALGFALGAAVFANAAHAQAAPKAEQPAAAEPARADRPQRRFDPDPLDPACARPSEQDRQLYGLARSRRARLSRSTRRRASPKSSRTNAATISICPASPRSIRNSASCRRSRRMASCG